MKLSVKALASALAMASAVAAPLASATEISGAGATFPYPLYAKWAQAYKQQTGVSVNYQSIGSGGGIKQIKAKTVTFGASDMPLKAKELDESGLVQFPLIMGGVVPVVNVRGVKPGDLVLDGATVAKIYMGEIKAWNDPAIKKLNPSLDLPSTAIAPVYRSDGSGTTFLFTDYLAKAAPQWKAAIGSATSVQWPAGIGGKGNEGVANMTQQTDGAIGYIEYAYAKQNKLSYTRMINSAGKAVTPESESFQAAAASADWKNTPGFEIVLTNEPGENSWPITGASFILMHKQPRDPLAATEALKFFSWAYKSGGEMAEQLDYVPMPGPVVQLVQSTWTQSIKGQAGPLWPGSH